MTTLDAQIRALHAERRSLESAKLVGYIGPAFAARLAEVHREIDRLEAEEQAAVPKVVDPLDALTVRGHALADRIGELAEKEKSE